MATDSTVSPLRQRMIEDMAARQLGRHSQMSHIRSCKRFAAFLKPVEANHLARAQAAAETEHHPDFDAPRHRQQPLGLVRAHDERQLLRLFEVIDLGSEIVPPAA